MRIDRLKGEDLKRKEGAKVPIGEQRMSEVGLLSIKSKYLADTVVVVSDKSQVKQARERHPGKAVYFLKEIKALREAYGDDVQSARLVHNAKKEFSGWIMDDDGRPPGALTIKSRDADRYDPMRFPGGRDSWHQGRCGACSSCGSTTVWTGPDGKPWHTLCYERKKEVSNAPF